MLLKLTSSSAWVLNVAAGKEVRPVQFCHVLDKLIPLERFNAGKEVRLVQSCHAASNRISSSASVLNVRAGKEASEVQPYHAYWKSVPAVKSIVFGMEVSEVQACHVLLKLVAPEKSNASNFGVTRSVLLRQ